MWDDACVSLGAPNNQGWVNATLVVSDGVNARQFFPLGPYSSHAVAQSVTSLTMAVLTALRGMHGSFTTDDVHRAIAGVRAAAPDGLALKP